MKQNRIYNYIHLCNGILLLVLLLTGAVLYLPPLRILFHDFRWEIIQFHSVIGVIYSIFVAASIPSLVRYLRTFRSWQKTFHICLQLCLVFGWLATGVYLWLNFTEYLAVRQTSIWLHDGLSFFIVPWVLCHISLWLVKKAKLFPAVTRISQRDKGPLLSRRDVLLLFAGSVTALLMGGILRWIQPISQPFLAGLEQVKKKGYFRIYSVTSENPVFDPITWRLIVDGLVETPMQFSFDQLMKEPQHLHVHDFHCVTGWSVTGVQWKGIPFAQITKLVHPKPEAIFVKMYSADGLYMETYTLAQLMNPNVLLVHEIEGKRLIPSQGAPLRLFHPDMYGYKSIKWLNRIEFTQQRDLGYWEEQENYAIDGYIS